MSLLQLSSCRLFAGFSPLSTTFLKKLLYNGAIKKGSRLQHSGVFINSFILCSLFRGSGPRRDRASRSSKNASSLDSSERRKCPLTRPTVNDKLIASVLLSEPSKGECFQYCLVFIHLEIFETVRELSF